MTTKNQLLEPKPLVEPLKNAGVWTLDSVDYDTHPAYQQFIGQSDGKLRLKALGVFLKSFMLVLAKRLIRYELIPLQYRKATSVGERIKFFTEAFKNAVSFGNSAKHMKLEQGVAREAFNCVDENGICAVKLTDQQTDTLERIAQDSFDYLVNRRENSGDERVFEDSRSYKKRNEHPQLFNCIEQILQQTGVVEAAGKYLGRSVSLIDVNPQINDSSDDFWRKTFPDLELEHPPTSYFHRDASGGDLKVIFYMSDVEMDNGPFNYVLGSHAMKLSRLDDYICEANDSNGLGGTGVSARQKFAALPRFLRQKGTFGNDLRESDKLQQDVLNGCWQVLAPKGSLVMFDTKGIHRGGLVKSGERRVITCIIG